MEELIKWHPVSEPPKESGEYLCYYIIPHGYHGTFQKKMGQFHYYSNSYVCDSGWSCTGIIITHWAELPNKPKEAILWKN